MSEKEKIEREVLLFAILLESTKQQINFLDGHFKYNAKKWVNNLIQCGETTLQELYKNLNKNTEYTLGEFFDFVYMQMRELFELPIEQQGDARELMKQLRIASGMQTKSNGKSLKECLLDLLNEAAKPIKHLDEINPEQAIEIAKLIYPFDGEGFEYFYQPYDPSWLDDAREYVYVKFKGITFGDRIDNLRLEIHPDLSCSFYYVRDMSYALPVRNQYAIQSKFREWNIHPRETKK